MADCGLHRADAATRLGLLLDACGLVSALADADLVWADLKPANVGVKLRSRRPLLVAFDLSSLKPAARWQPACSSDRDCLTAVVTGDWRTDEWPEIPDDFACDQASQRCASLRSDATNVLGLAAALFPEFLPANDASQFDSLRSHCLAPRIAARCTVKDIKRAVRQFLEESRSKEKV